MDFFRRIFDRSRNKTEEQSTGKKMHSPFLNPPRRDGDPRRVSGPPSTVADDFEQQVRREVEISRDEIWIATRVLTERDPLTEEEIVEKMLSIRERAAFLSFKKETQTSYVLYVCDRTGMVVDLEIGEYNKDRTIKNTVQVTLGCTTFFQEIPQMKLQFKKASFKADINTLPLTEKAKVKLRDLLWNVNMLGDIKHR